MADNSESRAEGRQVLPIVPKPRREPYRRSRLPVMPLAVLLPSIGELSNLSDLAPNFERRLQRLHEEKESAAGSGRELDLARRAGEESMLNQVIQWLNSDGEDQ